MYFVEALEPRQLLTAYYVSPTGLDTNPGTQTSPWQTLAKVAATNFKGGDSILFQGGANFFGASLFLDKSDTGSAAAPITIGSYGTGRATIGGTNGAGIYCHNTAGVSINNINVSGTGAANTSGGIFFYNDLPNNVKLAYIRINNVDTSGFEYGISIGGGLGSSGFSDVRITNVTAHDNSRAGVFSWAASTNVHSNVYVGYVKSYNNLGVAGLYASRGTVTGHGIVLGSVNSATIERSVAHDNGSLGDGGAGIWTYDSTKVTIQYNESYNNRTGGTHDGDGFDLDQNVSNSVMQYNYSHGNDGGGYLLAHRIDNSVFTGNVVRYNISANDGRKNNYGAIHLWGRIINTEIYNNTVYLPPGINGLHAAIRIHSSGLLASQALKSVHFRNNVLQTAGGVPLVYISSAQLGAATDLKFQGNLYWSSGSTFTINWGSSTYASLTSFRTAGQEKNGAANTGLQADPKLSTPAMVQTFDNADLLKNLASYKLQSGSPAINAGPNLSSLFGISTGGKDFWGTVTPQGPANDIGAHEFILTTPPPNPAFPLKINFQPNGTEVPAGYKSDSGFVYGPRSAGLTFGWNIDNTANARDRNSALSLDQRYDTLNHMQRGGTFIWEVSVPNGTYSVRIVSGDAGYFDGVFRISAEGVLVVNASPTSASRWVEGMRTVSVADGRLTIASAAGAVNNKICFVEISQVSAATAAPAPPGNAANPVFTRALDDLLD